MGRVLWDCQAKEDLRAIALFIGTERHSPEAARRLIDSVVARCDVYAAQPHLGEARPDLAPDVRVFPVGNYVVVYLSLDDGLHVLRVFDARRDYPKLFRLE